MKSDKFLCEDGTFAVLIIGIQRFYFSHLNPHRHLYCNMLESTSTDWGRRETGSYSKTPRLE